MSDLLTARDYYKPFAYPEAYENYKTAQVMHWLPTEVQLSDDVDDWHNKLTDAERALLTQLFRFFTQADADVARGYFERYLPAFKHPEVRMMLSAFATAEANHIDSYSLLLDTIGMPDTEYAAFQQFEEMLEKHEYMFAERSADLNEREKLALDMAIFSAFGEGMQLFSSFAILMNFQNLGKMKGMSTIIEWSIRDETHHVESMINLFHTLISENPEIWRDDFKAHIYQACRDMVALEDKFIDLAFSEGGVEGITPEDTKQYIRFIANRRLNQLGLKSEYDVEGNPFDWLDWITGAPTHTNFFEQRSTEYSKEEAKGWDVALNKTPGIAMLRAISFPNGAIIVTGNDCSWCALAKSKLRQIGADFDEISSSSSYGQSLLKLVGQKTVPQVFSRSAQGSVEGYVGTCEEFLDYAELKVGN